MIQDLTFPSGALSHIGKLSRPGSRRLWVDAICIDQRPDALQEKADQVALMTRIFSVASTVWCWLGQSEIPGRLRHTDRMFSEVEHILDQPLTGDDKQLYTAVAQILDKEENEEARHGLREIIQAPYWKRAWIWQEASSQNRLDFLYGDIMFNRAVLSIILFSIYPHMKKYGTQTGLSITITDFLALAFRRSMQKLLPLGELVGRIRACDSTDPRDKVYAISGLMEPIGNELIVPDYRTPVAELYTLVAKMMAHPGPAALFHVLSLVWFTATGEEGSTTMHSTSNHVPKVPSWVPDWRVQAGPSPLHAGYNAATQAPAEYSFERSHLRMRGFCIDRIVTRLALSKLDNAQSQTNLVADLVKKWFKKLPTLPKYSATGETIE